MPTMPAAPAVKPRKTKLEDALAVRRAAMRTKFDALETKAYNNGSSLEALKGGRWGCFAGSLGVSEHTVAHWVRVGFVPRPMALAIERTYGAALVSAEELGQVIVSG